jgi:hypothetical protein
VKLSLCSINLAPYNEDVWRNGGIAQLFLTSALDRCELSPSRPGRFTPGESVPTTHWIEGWVGPRAGLSLAPAGNRIPVVKPVARRYTI